jgi:PIN domain nuclease of toxin-antitoxin system
VRFLLDTHALLWSLSAPARLPSPTAAAIRDPSNSVYVSAASVWEIAIKTALGKLTADVDEIVRSIVDVGFEELPVTSTHARRLFALPAHHRDPFDRMLVAQAFEEGLTVVTRDPSFAAYRVPTAWA